MPGRPGWNDNYWKSIDKETQKKLRTTCPHCGSTKTYYNERFKSWRCGRCEHSFIVKGVHSGIPWWKRLFKRG